MPSDKYANQGYVKLSPTLNTLSFGELATFVSIFEKKAFLINRVEYFWNVPAMIEFDAETDNAAFGLSTSDTFDTAGLGVSQIFDYNMLLLNLQAAGVSGEVIWEPYVKDLSTLPGGGSLVPCRPIFLWCATSGFTVAGVLEARIYFTVVDLKADEYWELVEATRLVGA